MSEVVIKAGRPVTIQQANPLLEKLNAMKEHERMVYEQLRNRNCPDRWLSKDKNGNYQLNRVRDIVSPDGKITSKIAVWIPHVSINMDYTHDQVEAIAKNLIQTLDETSEMAEYAQAEMARYAR